MHVTAWIIMLASCAAAAACAWFGLAGRLAPGAAVALVTVHACAAWAAACLADHLED